MRVAIALVVIAALAGCSGGHTASATKVAAPACGSPVLMGVLPVWARGGFSDPLPKLPHVLGRSGQIAALVFGYPLLSPPSKTRSNKILWVSKVPVNTLTNLRISAQRMDGGGAVDKPVRRLVQGGPGPSIIDLPAAGCWRLSLAWSGHRDQLDLSYRSSM
jgi:hypothetical protein